MKNYLLKSYIVAILFIAPLHIPLKAQIRNFQVTGGLTTMWITSENIARERIFPRSEEEMPGAGFDGQQAGISLRMLYGIDAVKNMRVTAGLDYYFLRGIQRNQFTSSTLFFTYSVDMPTLVLGTEYALLEYPPGDARIYAGIEARGALTIAKPINFRLVRLKGDTLIQSGKGEIKENAFRLGGAVRLGIDGEIYDPFYVNFSVGYGIINLVGRDDSRGELFTPNHTAVGYIEAKENFIHNMLVSFLIQYRF
jgi:hypothetical protein